VFAKRWPLTSTSLFTSRTVADALPQVQMIVGGRSLHSIFESHELGFSGKFLKQNEPRSKSLACHRRLLGVDRH
jgi:hypothetical protein